MRQPWQALERSIARIPCAPSIRWLAALLLACLAQVAEAQTFITFDSEPGEPIFDGQDRVLGPPDHEFEVQEFVPSQGAVALRLRNLAPVGGIYTLEFATRPGDDLFAAAHVAVEQPMGAANPRIRVSSSFRTCVFPGEGAFRVLEAEGANNALPDRLALDFQFRCPGTTGVLRGAIRINSTLPATPAAPVAVASGPQLVDEGDVVTLDGRWSWAGPAAITGHSWRQVSGPAVTLSDPAAIQPTFVAAADAGVLSPLVFELTVTDALGNQSSAQVTVGVYDVAAPQTYVALQSDPGEYVLAGQSYLFRSPDVPITWRFLDPTRSSMEVVTETRIVFGGPDGLPLIADNYEEATRFGFHSPTGAGLSLGGFARGCNGELGRFTIYEIETDPATGLLTRLAMDFERRCTSFPDSPAKAYGQVRINSAVPRQRLAPLAAAGIDQLADELRAVQLDGRNSRPGASPIATWRWEQLAGPEVAIAGADTPQASFTAPMVASGSVELLFELAVTDSEGRADTDQMRVTVLSASALRNLLRIDGSRGDYIGQGVDDTFDDYDGAFVITRSGPNKVLFEFRGGPLSYGFELGAAGSQPLIPDNYEDAERGSDPSPRRPSMWANSIGRGCNEVAGRFVVREIVFGAGGDVERLAVDLEHYCDGQSVPLLAALRYRSSVPVVVPEPTSAAGADQRVLERDAVVLDGRNTMPGAGNITAWRWRQTAGTAVTLAGAGESIATFNAPLVPAPGETLRFELQVDSSNGQTDADVIEVFVQDKLSPRSFATLLGRGEYIAFDQDHYLDEQDGEFRVLDLGQGRPAMHLHWLGAGDDWRFELFSTTDLAVGHYVVDPQIAEPTIAVSAGGRGCNDTRGTFDILDIAFAGDVVSRIAVNFEQFCDHIAVPLRGKLRFNVTMPDAHAGADVAATGRSAVSLSGSQSAAGIGALRSYEWRQLAGPAVAISGANAVNASFTAPDIAVATTLTFSLTVTDDRGIDDIDIVAVQVSPAPAPPPPQGGGGGGGGGTGWPVVAMLALLQGLAWRRRNRAGATSGTAAA